MENNIIPEETPVQVKDNEKPDKNKRQVLPAFTLEEMLTFTSKIYTELGFGAFHNKDLIAKSHGLVYDSIKQKFSSAQMYGLLELKFGTGYKLTPLFLKVYKPEN